MSDPIEEALRHGCTGVMHHPPDRRCVEALEALAVLRGQLEREQRASDVESEVLTLRYQAAEASVVSLKEALREIVGWTTGYDDTAHEWMINARARAALASSEGEGDA